MSIIPKFKEGQSVWAYKGSKDEKIGRITDVVLSRDKTYFLYYISTSNNLIFEEQLTLVKGVKNLNIIKQKFANICDNGRRLYIEDQILSQIGLNPGLKFKTEINKEKNTIKIIIAEDSEAGNKISRKIKKSSIIPVIDKTGSEIEAALQNCKALIINFLEKCIIIRGVKDTAKALKEKLSNKNELTCLTFCAGAGITSFFNKKAGFKEIAAIEYNPKEGSKDKFSELYMANHKEVTMFNMPMEKISGKDLPNADIWIATLDCTDFSKLSSSKKEYQTMHLFVHLIRIFYEKRKTERPKTILIENVPEFEKIAGNVLKLCFQEEGYEVTMERLNSINFGSRTKRERFFFFASIFKGFQFPKQQQQLQTPIIQDNVITLETLNFKSIEENNTLKYYLNRDCKTHNHKFKTIDITKDCYFETIVKQHSKYKATNWIKHPTEDKYAYIEREEHLKYLHNIPKEYCLGTSFNNFAEAIGQSVCGKTYYSIIKTIHQFMSKFLLNEKQLQLNF